MPYMETLANLNIRKKGRVLETVPQGTILIVNDNVWREVELDGGGYALASGQFMRPYEGEVEAPPLLVIPQEPRHLIIARGELGVKEIAGGRHNPRIVAYHQTCSLKATDDDTPWCSAFVNWCIIQAGLRGTNSAAAISWMQWGRSIPLAQGQPGDIAVFSRSGGNHVGFHISHDDNALRLLGGNQNDEVNIATFSRARFLGLRRAA
jgi:uncharacterized protein (TIGR02594 family)